MSLYVNIKKCVEGFTLNVNFKAENEVIGLLGASGCGKSMTLKCISGIENPDEGRIVLDDRVLFDSENKINVPPQQRRIGYLFQNYALFPNMTVEENIAAGISCPKDEKARRVKEKVKMFFLQGLEKKRPHQLSGGQQQRVALARILASEPDMILLDEPFSALDSNLKWQLEQELMELLLEFRGIVILVSHNRNEVYRFSETVAVIESGEINSISKKEELFKNPKTLSAAMLTGCKNISRAVRLTEHTLNAIDWGAVLYSSSKIPENIRHVGMRAHYIRLAENNEQPNTITGRVIKVIENPFSYIILFVNDESTGEQGSSKIRWEVDKEVWRTVTENKFPLQLVFDKDNLLLLE